MLLSTEVLFKAIIAWSLSWFHPAVWAILVVTQAATAHMRPHLIIIETLCKALISQFCFQDMQDANTTTCSNNVEYSSSILFCWEGSVAIVWFLTANIELLMCIVRLHMKVWVAITIKKPLSQHMEKDIIQFTSYRNIRYDKIKNSKQNILN